MSYSVTAERAIEGVKLLKEELTFEEALTYLDVLYTSYSTLRGASFAKIATQVQVRDDAGMVVYRAGPI